MYNTGDNIDYYTGDDFVLDYGEHHLHFSEPDFQERVERAARRIHLIDLPLNADELSDLVQFTVSKKIDEPRSPLADHLTKHQEALLRDDGIGGSPIAWLCRQVFREASLDQLVMDGKLDVKFNPKTGIFKYVNLPPDDSEVQHTAPPSFPDLAYHTEP